MPRNRSAGRPAPRPAARPMSSRAPPPAHVQQAPPPAVPQSGGGSMLGGLASTIAQGMAFGTGSAVAHRAVDAVVGPRTIQHEHVQSTDGAGNSTSAQITNVAQNACSNQTKAFQDCIQANNDDIGKCQFYVDMLNECRRGSSSMTL
ncbi:hypothetical protein MPTK1_2g18810 [Marchantia polymorpha subsp. ruderalis]|uniref:CHCH domain-containing protein n=1 Tax=Marchantia polymorpha TaxID=3197 RepID=A0A2R6W6Z6_MARPO|nr:hypothetical protein MARPO_0137s0002 [Marchantia polymorpha]BBN02870.1 hypothetical protein Mp_2g18810 [Marchantia polymorpha subsp. ruderalis]|eukprot:PTQ29627.1 hypothetical protein MARPO_0137s0002 [Marchantia polymorpha]